MVDNVESVNLFLNILVACYYFFLSVKLAVDPNVLFADLYWWISKRNFIGNGMYFENF